MPSADLVVTKVNSPDPVVAGQPLTSTITVRNGGPSPAAGVVVTDELPPGLGTVTAASTHGTCTVTADVVTCEIGTLGPSAVATVTVQAAVPPGSTAATLTDIARVTSPTADPDPDDNTAGASTDVTRSADLAVTKVADNASVAAGGGITFTVTMTNTGPSDATNVVLTDLLPAPLVFSADASDDECAPGAGGVVCTLATIASGTSRALTIGATLPSDAAPGTVTNTASVTSDVDDPDGDDNSASVPVLVTQEADLAIIKTAAAEGVLLGDTIAYTLAVVNEGPSDATDVVVTDSIPEGTLVDTLPAECTEVGGEIECALDSLAAGDTVLLEIVLEVPDTLPPGPLPNSASVSSPIGDPDPSDNSSETTVEAVAQADVTLEKRIVTANPVAGQPVVYELILTNNGPTVAPNASL